MIGIVVIAHSDLAEALERAVAMIFGERPKAWQSVSVLPSDTPEQIMEKIKGAVGRARTASGLLVFTDMLGGTPSNVSMPFVEEGRTELVSGVNLPMVVKALQEREQKPLPELAERVRQWGKESIHRASEYLKSH